MPLSPTGNGAEGDSRPDPLSRRERGPRGSFVKIVRFKAGGKTRYGALEGNRVVEYAGTPYSTFRI